jgi:hypothetical protein
MFKAIKHSMFTAAVVLLIGTHALAGTGAGHRAQEPTSPQTDSAKPGSPGGGGIPTGPTFQIQLAVDLRETFVGTNSFTVPSGKRLVIEYVSASGVVPSGSSLIYSVTTGSVQHWIPVTQQAADSYQVLFIAGQQTRLYAEPGTTVIVGVLRAGIGGTASANISISGSLVDVQ